MVQERLQKLIAQAGVASRRAAEAIITEGRVRVNGRVVTLLGAKADPVKDKVEVDGRRLVAEKPVYYLLHKPRSVVTTLEDPEGRETIRGLLKGVPERVFPVGRLDFHTSGALVVTNDGVMAQALLHPQKVVPKTYVAKVRGHLDVPQLDALRKGVDIGMGEKTQPAEVFVLREERNNTWLQLTITEGKNRQVHRMLEAIGSRVNRLARVAFAGLTLEGLRPGDYRELSSSEMQKLKRDYLNPQKRADAEKARREAIDLSAFSLGFDPGPNENEEDVLPRPSIPRPRRPPAPPKPERQPKAARAPGRKGKPPRKGESPRKVARKVARKGETKDAPRSKRTSAAPAVEVMTVRRRIVTPSPTEKSTPPPSPSQNPPPRKARIIRPSVNEEPPPASKPRSVRKVIAPRLDDAEETESKPRKSRAPRKKV